MKKVIFITSCHPLISRNILSTELLGMLINKSVQVVLIVPETKQDFFSKTFNRDGIIVKGIKAASGKREGVMRYLSLAALSTKTLDIKRHTEMRGSGLFLHHFLGNKFSRSIIRIIERLSYSQVLFESLFDEYDPYCVFATDIQNEIDIALLNEARVRKIHTIGMVRSWDNLTSKGLIRSLPAVLLVWNEIIKKEAIVLHDTPEAAISIIGIPHYDAYRTYDYSDRESFFRKIGGDSGKKMLLFIPIGDRYLNDNSVDRDIVAILDEILPDNYQILVRLPPGDYVRELEGGQAISQRISVLYDRAYGTSENIKMTELRKDDDIHLAQTLHWSDLIVSGPSTVIIDGVYMNKPVILFGFDGHKTKEYFESIRRYYDYDNFIPILKSGGVRLASSKDEFIGFVKSYIQSPNQDEAFRNALASKEASYLDGKSTERLFNQLILTLPA